MGRTPKPPGLDAAMGSPGRRPSKTRAVTKPASSPGVAMPDYLGRGREFADARRVWDAAAPMLARLNVVNAADAHALARYCVHVADWVRITKTLAKEGETQTVKTVAGDPMIRIHPLVKRRDGIEKHLLEAEDRFGLNPTHRISLYRDMGALGAPVGDLFGYRPPEKPAAPAGGPSGEIGSDGIIGFARLDRGDTPPRPN